MVYGVLECTGHKHKSFVLSLGLILNFNRISIGHHELSGNLYSGTDSYGRYEEQDISREDLEYFGG